MIHRLAISVFLVLSTAAALADRPQAPDSLRPGPFNVSNGEYRFAAAIDADVLPRKATEVWARVFWPRDLSQPRPLLVFLHGNHATCGAGRNPRVNSDCTYTDEGRCPEGFVVVPNHDGYNYAAENLASHGYIVVSINANRGITCGDSVRGDSGLILARGRLVLRHLQLWKRWSTVGGAPVSLGAGAGGFIGAVSFAHVGLMGHSRGGEGMRAAYNLYVESGSRWQRRIPGLAIRGIYEIGAVDGQSSRVLDADNTAWNQPLPMCDGDVSELEGRRPFERMILKRRESRETPKSLYMVWGANHNFFNTEWQENDSFQCQGHEPIHGPGPESEAQKTIATASLSAFFRAHVSPRPSQTMALHFDPLALLPASLTRITRIERDYIPTYDVSYDVRVDDFNRATGTSTRGQRNLSSGITYQHEYDQPNRANVTWSQAGENQYLQVNWTSRGRAMPVSRYRTLDFRVARQYDHLGSTEATDFTVYLADAGDRLSRGVPVSRFAEILGPASHVATYQTVRIPLAEFGLAPDAQVRGVRFTFNRSRAAKIYLANVRFTAPIGSPKDAFAGDFPEIIDRAMKLPGRAAPEYPAILTGARGPKEKQHLPTVELTFESPSKFPVSNALPVLVIGGRKFTVSRYASPRSTSAIVFELTHAELESLPETAPMWIQYGQNRASAVWRLPDFEKSKVAK